MGFFDGFEDDCRARGSDAGNAADARPQHRSKMLGVPRANFDQIAVLARDMMDFEHFRQPRQLAGDVVVARRLLAANSDEGEHAAIDDPRIDVGGIASNDPPRLEFSEPLQNGRRRQPDGAGDIHLRLPRIRLENLKNLNIYVVYCSVNWQHNRILYCATRLPRANLLADC